MARPLPKRPGTGRQWETRPGLGRGLEGAQCRGARPCQPLSPKQQPIVPAAPKSPERPPSGYCLTGTPDLKGASRLAASGHDRAWWSQPCRRPWDFRACWELTAGRLAESRRGQIPGAAWPLGICMQVLAPNMSWNPSPENKTLRESSLRRQTAAGRGEQPPLRAARSLYLTLGASPNGASCSAPNRELMRSPHPREGRGAQGREALAREREIRVRTQAPWLQEQGLDRSATPQAFLVEAADGVWGLITGIMFPLQRPPLWLPKSCECRSGLGPPACKWDMGSLQESAFPGPPWAAGAG